MTEKAKEARRAYKREWNKKNPDKIKQYNETFWNKKAAEYEKTIKAAADAIEQGGCSCCDECGLC